jgi:hypothetical protein
MSKHKDWDSCNEIAWNELEWWLEDYGLEIVEVEQ